MPEELIEDEKWDTWYGRVIRDRAGREVFHVSPDGYVRNTNGYVVGFVHHSGLYFEEEKLNFEEHEKVYNDSVNLRKSYYIKKQETRETKHDMDRQIEEERKRTLKEYRKIDEKLIATERQLIAWGFEPNLIDSLMKSYMRDYKRQGIRETEHTVNGQDEEERRHEPPKIVDWCGAPPEYVKDASGILRTPEEYEQLVKSQMDEIDEILWKHGSRAYRESRLR